MQAVHSDMRWVTSTSESGDNLADLAKRGVLGYPPLSVQAARALLVKDVHTNILATSFGLSVCAILLLLCEKTLAALPLRRSLQALVLLSFPVQLALERGNIDIVIFILLASISTLSVCRNRLIQVLTSLLAALTVGIKFYPLFGLFSWPVWNTLFLKRTSARFTYSLALVVGSVIGLLLVIPWYLSSGGAAAQSGIGVNSHGLLYRISYIESAFNSLPVHSSGISRAISLIGGPVVFLAGILVARASGLKKFYLEILGTSFSPAARVVANELIGLTYSVWIFCYILTGSYDYRMVLALPGYILLIAVVARHARFTRRRFLFLFTLFSLSISLLIPLPLYSLYFYLPDRLNFAIALISKLCDYLLIPLLSSFAAYMIFAPTGKAEALPSAGF